MKRVLVLAFAFAFAAPAVAQYYKWIDKDGRVTYSDQPPPAQESKQLSVGSGTGATTSPARTAVERDKELGKSRLEALEKSKAAEEASKRAQIEEENCNRARAYLRTVSSGGRIVTYDSKGDSVLLEDDRIQEEQAKARKLVDEVCKAS